MSKRLNIFIVVTLGYVAGCTTSPPPPVQSPPSQARSSGDFVTTWELTQDTLTIHTGEGEFDYQVDWDNDGVFDEQRWTGPATHTYDSPGTYTVRIKGRFPHARQCKEDAESAALLAVEQWGAQRWGSMRHMFFMCHRVVLRAPDQPDLREVTDMTAMFSGARAFNQPINAWDVSNVTSMSLLFEGAHAFNQPLSDWDVSKVQYMNGMFLGAKAFNQPLEAWNTSKVTDMNAMFTAAHTFNQPLDAWDVSNVTDMSAMFFEAKAFNQPLLSWRVAASVNVAQMFEGASAFKQDLSTWEAKP